MNRHVHLRTANFAFLRTQPPQHFEWLRIDANDNCNLNCVYCRVPRSDGMIDRQDLQEFFAENVVKVDNLQFGCGMEPTIDHRLVDLIEMAAESNAKPRLRFSLQTNGLMLHQHDLERFKQAGLNLLSVSMDSTDANIHKQLRGGSSVEKIVRNLKAFKHACPDISIQIVAVITSLNIGDALSLADFAVDLGVKRMVFREMVYLPESKNIDHGKVQDLIVPPGEFVAMRDRVLARHNGKTDFSFLETEHLKDYGQKSRTNSYPKRLASPDTPGLDALCSGLPTTLAPFLFEDFEWKYFSVDPANPNELSSTRLVDPLIPRCAKLFGGFEGCEILELGPMEGFHSVALSKENPKQVISVEANPRNFFKCLSVKEHFKLQNVEFMLGDFKKYLESKPKRFDFILAAGVLYHVAEPFRVMDMIMDLTDAFGVCTTFYDADDQSFTFSGISKEIVYPGTEPFTVYHRYNDSVTTRGKKHGIEDSAWLFTREDFLRYLDYRNFDVEVFENIRLENSGPRVRLFAKRRK